MSASREKRSRQGTQKPVANTAPVKKSNIGKWLIGIVCIVLVVALSGVSLLLNSTWPHKNLTAATIGDYKLTPADYNYYYKQAYVAMAQQFGENSSNMMSFFGDSIMASALRDAQTIYAAYDLALKAGYTLTEEEQTEIDETISMFEETSGYMGYKNADEYLAYAYGKGCDTENYRNFFKVTMLAQRYMEDQLDAYTASEADTKAYYEAHRNEIDLLTYRQYLIPVTETRDLAAAQAAADKMVQDAIADEASFDKHAYELADETNKPAYAEEGSTILTGIRPSLMTEGYVDAAVAEWLGDLNRKKGDTATIVKGDQSGVFVLYFLERDVHNYNARDLRAIYVSVAADAAEETWNSAKEEAQGYLDEYLKSDKTAEAFGKIADDHSDAALPGGLTENVGKQDINYEVNTWLYAPERKVGDVDMVKAADGYYILMYCGDGDNYWNVLMDATMDSQYFEKMTADFVEAYPAVVNEGGRKYVTTTNNFAM